MTDEEQFHNSGKMRAVSTPKILIADDNETELGVIRIVLEAEGFEVAAMDSLFELSIEIKRHRPDVIVLDVMMPGLSGDRAARILKHYEFSRGIPVILHSSKSEDKLAALAKEADAQGFVSKTGDFAKLVSEIRRVLGSDPR